MIGTTISHYTILEKLGEGGMGVVYKARDATLDRVVALKFLPVSSKATEVDRARFMQEARTAAALNHPNICTIYNIEEHDDRQFIVMEYVDGETLHARIGRQPSLAVDEVAAFAEQIGEALHDAHSHGIIHRDIKSENIMVNSKNQIKVMDFGLAKLKDSIRLTRLLSTVGTLGFMAPELIQGEDADARSDVFSFGVVMYEMLAGRLPFRGEHDAAIIYSIVNEEPQPLAEPVSPIASSLQKVIMNCLVKEPANRYQAVSEILADLQGDTTGKERPTKEASEIWSRLKQKKSLLVGGAIAGLAAIVAATYFLSPAFRSSPETKSVAVLPFKNMSPEKESEYFSDGVTEDIIARISTIGGIKVISRTSAMRYKQTEKSMRDIASELDVATVLEGSVKKTGNRVRIVAQLIDASDNEHLWGETYDRELTEIFAIQTDVALKTAAALKAALSPAATEEIATPPTTDVTAYQLYLQGRDYYYRNRKEDNDHAIALFNRAVVHDPRYALAYAGLAECQFEAGMMDEALNTVAKLRGLKDARGTILYPLSYYLLGKIYEKKNEKKLAIENYEKFLDIWKDADKDLPDYVDAKTRVAKLKGVVGK